MANLTEAVSYDTGVYQIETTDPVTGGPTGIANKAAINLANRTKYLKSRVDALEAGTTVPPTMATLASPVFTGNPTAPTPAVGDDDTSLATTAFVQATSSAFAKTLLDDTSAAMARGTLGAAKSGENTDITSLSALTASISSVYGSFYKVDSQSVAFAKTAAATASIKAGTIVDVFGVKVAFDSDTSIIMPTLTAGNDYAIYACQDGSVRADASFVKPTGYTTANSRLVGGFHYGLVASGTTLAGGSFATTGNGMIWTQANVNDIAGINKYSLWDLKWRPHCSPRGMALVGGRTWVDLYLCNTDTAANGTSKAGSNIASSTVLPKIPAAFNGNGTATYPALNWWVANELARASQKRLMWEHEFVEAAFGVTENQSIDATTSTYPTTQRNAGYTSKYGLEQASGHHWTWGQDASYRTGGTASEAYYDVNGNNGAGTGRGQVYLINGLGLVRALFGGARTGGVYSGSRASTWNNCPWGSNWLFGLRAACDHLILV